MMKTLRKSALILLIGVVMSSCASGPPRTPRYYPNYGVGPTTVTGAGLTSGLQVPRTIHHEVGPSETLWRISKTYDVDMQTLMRVNSIADPTKIQNGQVLVIPNTHGPMPVIPLYPSRKWTHIIIHHTATYGGNARSIDQLHHKRGFWNGLGYHFLVNNGTNGKWDGQIEVGPRWIKQKDGAHAKDDHMNERGIGVSIVGNYSESEISEASLRALVYVVQTLMDYYKISKRNVIGHRHVNGANTECPGDYFPWSEFRRRLR